MNANADGTVSVRMYNVGFGDCFLVTVRNSGTVWRMVVDCGVHRQGQVNSLKSVVEALIADITVDGLAHVDVLVATHKHADHISGFALPAWGEVSVGEVWVPFVEDLGDPDALAIRESHDSSARKLMQAITRQTLGLHSGAWPYALRQAESFAINSLRNEDATNRLLGRNGKGFANNPTIRYLPYTDDKKNKIFVPEVEGSLHILGPSRSPAMLKAMTVPKAVSWLRLDDDNGEDDVEHPLADTPLFNPQYWVPDDDDVPQRLLDSKRSLSLAKITKDDVILTAASILERSVNNTSLFFVLEVAGIKLLFPGDAQHGAWEHVLSTNASVKLLSDIDFYKISHHGSHNGTPKRFVEEVWTKSGTAMLPWGFVKRWKDTIPKKELLEALGSQKHKVVHPTELELSPEVTVHDEEMWTEVVLKV